VLANPHCGLLVANASAGKSADPESQ